MNRRLADGAVVAMTAAEIARRDAEHAELRAQAEQREALHALRDIDERSIRAMREHLAAQGHQTLQALEAEAEVHRARLREPAGPGR